MKLKLAIIFGIAIWIITYFFTEVLNPFFSSSFANINIIAPATVIIATTLFGIFYIRNIDNNEVIEGLILGVIFIAIDIILDLAFFIIPHKANLIFMDYQLHVFSMIIITLLITTFLGYLAQMNIDLK
jgi:putative effector of murein hydrolase